MMACTEVGARAVHWATAQTSLGPALVAASVKGVCFLAFGGGEPQLRARFPATPLIEHGPCVTAVLDEVIAAIEAPSPAMHHIALDVTGTPFQRQVWEELRRIPLGEKRTYGELAAALGNPKATRAVGGANGANSIAVLIPCHRVIAAGGALGGYAWGTQIKAELLRREGAL